MFPCNQTEFQRFFQENRRPIWESRIGDSEEAAQGYLKYGKFDYGQFSELELRCYILIKAGIASMQELKEYYTLDEALKLYALYLMERDVEKGRADELERRSRQT